MDCACIFWLPCGFVELCLCSEEHTPDHDFAFNLTKIRKQMEYPGIQANATATRLDPGKCNEDQ